MPLYQAIVAEARAPHYYVDGRVHDNVDGRFDMVAAVLAITLLRLETEAQRESTLLTEIFIDDMESSLRQMGIGDFVVGKHVVKLMGALGGRLTAFRTPLSNGEGFREAVRHNIFHDTPPSEAAIDHVEGRLRALHFGLENAALETILAGRLT